jgi:pyruvate dehydrogenase E1 component alpha subunit
MNKEEIYYRMKLIRKAEEAIIREYPKNDIKTPCHLAIGAEAIATGVMEVFKNATVFASYRNHHWYFATGGNLNNFFLELYGKVNPIADGKAGSMHLNSPETGLIMTSAVVGTQFGPSVGYAFAQSYKRTKRITVCVSGDGATEEGAFCESLNIAALFSLPVLFVIEDNGLAIHQHKEDRQAFNLEKLIHAYDIPYIKSEGNDLTLVNVACKKITKLPAVVHFTYHRFYEHVGINKDYDAGYRSIPEDLKALDPLSFEADHLGTATIRKIDSRIDAEIAAAIKKAKYAPSPKKEKLLEHVYA